MVLRNGRPNDILSVSRDARANSTSQSTVLFPTVILAGCAALAICIGKSWYPFDTMRRASCRIACEQACMHACMCCVPMRLRFPSAVFPRKKDHGGDERRCQINIRLRSGCLQKTYETRSDVMVFLPRQIVLLVVDSVSSTSSIFSWLN